MPSWLIDPAFRREEPAALRRFYAKATRRKVIRPIEYGFIAIDFKTKEILSRQEYCAPGKWYSIWTRDGECCSNFQMETEIISRLLAETPPPEVRLLGAGRDTDGDYSPLADAKYVERLREEVDKARSVACDRLPAGVARSMDFRATHPFQVNHESRSAGYDWKAEVYDWLRARRWKSKIAKTMRWEEDE